MYRSLVNHNFPHPDDDDDDDDLPQNVIEDELYPNNDLVPVPSPAPPSKRLKTFADMPPVANQANIARLNLASKFKDDVPVGVANIMACLLLLEPVCEPDAKQNLLNFLGMTSYSDFLSLQNSCRKTFVLTAPKGAEVMKDSEAGREAFKKWEELKAERLDITNAVEDEVNAIVQPFLELAEPPFAPGTLSSGDDIPLLALLAMEKNKVEHMNFLPKYIDGEFQSSTGEAVPAKYAADFKRSMQYKKVAPGTVSGSGFRMVKVDSKPNEEGMRSLLFLLPDDESQTDLNPCLERLAEVMTQEDGLKWDVEKDINFRFPNFKADLPATSIVDHIKACGLTEVFSPEKKPFETCLPDDKCDGDVPPHLRKVLHLASFSADRKGAEAKAATVAIIGTYRSISASPPVERFHCTRPFAVVLADGFDDKLNIEFVLKVGGKCLDTSSKD